MSTFCGLIVSLALFLGIPISTIWLIVRIIKKKPLKPLIISLCSCIGIIIVFSILGASAWSKTDDYQKYLVVKQAELESKEQAELESKEQARIEKEKVQKEQAEQRKNEKEKTKQENSKHTEQESEARTESDNAEKTPKVNNAPPATTVHSTYLANNWDEFNEQYVTFSFPVYTCNDEQSSIEYMPDGSPRIIIYPDNYKSIDKGTYITVTGLVNTDTSYNNLVNAHIDSTGSIAQQNYESAKTDYENAFRAECEEVSYEDLFRYPDTYKDKKIKVNVHIKEVEPDGWILQGTIWATLSGNELVLYDERESREPRLNDGDNITLYGTGNGLTTIKTYDKSGIIPKVIDRYDVPYVNIMFLDMN